MAKKSRIDESREPGRYIALPASVLTSQAYMSLSHTAKSLLIEVALQRMGGDNGRLLLSQRYLATRGWHSGDVILRAKRELLAAKLIYETVQGHRPNKASWYALTWYTLDRLPGYDPGAAEGFRRGMYSTFQPSAPAPTRHALFDKWRGHGVTGQKKPAPKINRLTPSHGEERAAIAPLHGVEDDASTPSHGAIRGVWATPPTPSHGYPLDKPFCTGESLPADFVDSVAAKPKTPAAIPEVTPANDGRHFERVRECELDPTRFDPVTGDFCPPPPAPALQQKNTATRWVKTALGATGHRPKRTPK